MIKKRYVALFLCVFLLSSLFLCVGYAALTDTLLLSGTASATPGAYVYISKTELRSGSATDIAKSGTVLSSRVTLDNSASSQTVIRVTLKNNTEYPYTFNGITYTEGPDTYDNTAISVSANIDKGAELASGAETTFDVTFKYKSGVSTNKVLNSIINISYIPASEYIPEIAVKTSIGRFGEILNDETTYNTLITAMDTTSSGRRNTSYIGNVVGATDADTAAVNNLFTENGKNLLTLEIGGVETNVTAMIKREDIGGSTDKEMVIYMTGQEITGNIFNPATVQVFAAIYVQTESGEWVQKGTLYEGTATTNPYYISLSCNSFNTDTWRSAQTYHGVASGATIESVFAAVPD